MYTKRHEELLSQALLVFANTQQRKRCLHGRSLERQEQGVEPQKVLHHQSFPLSFGPRRNHHSGTCMVRIAAQTYTVWSEKANGSLAQTSDWFFCSNRFLFHKWQGLKKKKPRAKLHLEFIKMLDSLCPYTLYMEIGVWCLESEIHLVGPARLEWNPGLENILSEVANNGKNNRWILIIKITASSFLMYIWCDSWNRLCCSSEMHLY